MGLFRRKTETESEKIAKVSKQIEKEWTTRSHQKSLGIDVPRNFFHSFGYVKLRENAMLLKKSKDTTYLNMFSLIALEHKHYEEAVEWAKCALTINPKNKVSIDRLISIFMKIKDYNHALRWAKELVEVWPIAENYYFLASLYQKLDTLPNFENFARDNINKALELEPYNKKYHEFRNELDYIDTFDDDDDDD